MNMHKKRRHVQVLVFDFDIKIAFYFLQTPNGKMMITIVLWKKYQNTLV